MGNNLSFDEHDEVGESTLNVIAEADRFNEWMYNTIKPFCRGKILEIGSGIGNISKMLIEDDFQLMLTDIRQGYCKKLNAAFNKYPNFLGVEVMNLTDQDF